MRARLFAVLPVFASLLLTSPVAAQDATPTPIPREAIQTAPKQEPAAADADKKAVEPSKKETAKGKRTAAKSKAAAPASPMASCEETRNENGLRVLIYPPSVQNVRVAIFDRGGKEIERDLFTPAKGQATGYARVLWGTRNTPPEKLLKGAFLISTSQKGRFFEGMLMADGGDGSFMVQRMHLGKPEDAGKRWLLRLGVEQSLLCRVDGVE